jgi:hypothetical protein
MSYILKFVPFNDSTKFAGVGMAGNIMIILNELLSISNDSSVYVEINDYENICGSEKDINHWSLYFEQIDRPSESTIIEIKPPRPNNIDYKTNYNNNDDIMIKSNESFFKHFKLNSKIEDKINKFYDSFIKGVETLSCQIRLGDMVTNHGTSTIDIYLNRIKNILIENPTIKQIFLATDDENAITYLQENLEIPILYQTDVYRTSSNNPFERVYNERENHNYNLCEEVIIDIFLLGKCDYFLRADVSSVSIVATAFADKITRMYYM